MNLCTQLRAAMTDETLSLLSGIKVSAPSKYNNWCPVLFYIIRYKFILCVTYCRVNLIPWCPLFQAENEIDHRWLCFKYLVLKASVREENVIMRAQDWTDRKQQNESQRCTVVHRAGQT